MLLYNAAARLRYVRKAPMKQLNGIDAAFLAAESPRWPMHVASVTVFDPSKVEGGYSVARLKELLASGPFARLPASGLEPVRS